MEEVSDRTLESKSVLVRIWEGRRKEGKVGGKGGIEIIKVNTTEVAGRRFVRSWNGEVDGHGDG